MEHYLYSVVAKGADDRVYISRFDFINSANRSAEEYRQSAGIVSVEIIKNDVPAGFTPGVIYMDEFFPSP
jgi:hypothetical protein